MTLGHRFIETAREHLARWNSRTPEEQDGMRRAYRSEVGMANVNSGAWCAAFQSRVLADTVGRDSPLFFKSMSARRWGEIAQTKGWRKVDLSNHPVILPVGSILIYWRGKTPADWPGHIQAAAESTPLYTVSIGGNESNRIRERRHDRPWYKLPKLLYALLPPSED